MVELQPLPEVYAHLMYELSSGKKCSIFAIRHMVLEFGGVFGLTFH
jgi:hypothetical protein